MLLKEVFIKPATTKPSSLIVFRPDKDGLLHFCDENQNLNSIKDRNPYLLLRMDEFVDSLGKTTIFSTLDVNSCYWKIEIDPKNCEMTTFTCQHGLFQFTRTRFGLRSTPGTIQRDMDLIISSMSCRSALLYLDDIVNFSKIVKEHIALICQIPALLRDGQITLELKRCSFLAEKTHYFRHVIRPGQMEIAYTTIFASKEVKDTARKTKRRFFFALRNVLRRFVTDYSHIAAIS